MAANDNDVEVYRGSSAEKLDAYIIVRTTQRDKARFNKAAKARGLSMSDFGRPLLLKRMVPANDNYGRELVWAVSGMADSIARIANEMRDGGMPVDDRTAVMDRLDRLEQQFRGLLK